MCVYCLVLRINFHCHVKIACNWRSLCFFLFSCKFGTVIKNNIIPLTANASLILIFQSFAWHRHAWKGITFSRKIISLFWVGSVWLYPTILILCSILLCLTLVWNVTYFPILFWLISFSCVKDDFLQRMQQFYKQFLQLCYLSYHLR